MKCSKIYTFISLNRPFLKKIGFLWKININPVPQKNQRAAKVPSYFLLVAISKKEKALTP